MPAPLLPLLLVLLLFPLPLPLPLLDPLLLDPLPTAEPLPPPPPPLANPSSDAALDDDISDAAEPCAPRMPLVRAPLSAFGGVGAGTSATASSIAGQYTRIAVIRFSVSVPVLSVQM